MNRGGMPALCVGTGLLPSACVKTGISSSPGIVVFGMVWVLSTCKLLKKGEMA